VFCSQRPSKDGSVPAHAKQVELYLHSSPWKVEPFKRDHFGGSVKCNELACSEVSQSSSIVGC